MSSEYNHYITEHVDAVRHGLIWMSDNLPELDQAALSRALENVSKHDASKWANDEYDAYDKYFYGGNRSHKVVQDFNYAWLHHIHNNPHHWQYWILVNDDEEAGTVALKMPLEYVYEMIADWWSFSWRNDKLEEIFDWYDKHRERIIFHKQTRETVEKVLEQLGEKLELSKEYLAQHGITGQQWGVHNGPPYPLDRQTHNKVVNGDNGQSRSEKKVMGIETETAKVAQKIFERASQKSKAITRSVEDAADSAGGKLHGLEHQLKTAASIERKINKKVDEKNMSVSDAANSIKDALRYTVIAPTDAFVDMYEGFKDSMTRQGYTETSCDNYFDKFKKGEVKHKAVQSNFADADGYEFEVQFHTPESQDAKDKKLPLYEERRSSGVSESRKRELEKQMEDLALNVPDPKGIESIRTHR